MVFKIGGFWDPSSVLSFLFNLEVPFFKVKTVMAEAGVGGVIVVAVVGVTADGIGVRVDECLLPALKKKG